MRARKSARTLSSTAMTKGSTGRRSVARITILKCSGPGCAHADQLRLTDLPPSGKPHAPRQSGHAALNVVQAGETVRRAARWKCHRGPATSGGFRSADGRAPRQAVHEDVEQQLETLVRVSRREVAGQGREVGKLLGRQ